MCQNCCGKKKIKALGKWHNAEGLSEIQKKIIARKLKKLQVSVNGISETGYLKLNIKIFILIFAFCYLGTEI
jgi:hypothetical protein